MAIQRRAAIRLLIRTRWRRPTLEVAPELSDEQRDDVLAVGRQIITLTACAVFIVSGHLSGYVEAGYATAWHAFALGAVWVALIDDGEDLAGKGVGL